MAATERKAHGVQTSDDSRTNSPTFLSPAEVCARWHIDERTMNKLTLPWIWLSERVRRIRLDVVEEYERTQRLGQWSKRQ